MPKRIPPMNRLMTKVGFSLGPLPTRCWVSTYADNGHGYTYVNVDRRKVYAHRLSYEHYVGPIPPGLDLDHLCRVRRCVNPYHLEPVTRQENVRRGTNGPTRKETCRQGHSLTDAYVDQRTGHRSCRPCSKNANAAYYRRRKDNDPQYKSRGWRG